MYFALVHLLELIFFAQYIFGDIHLPVTSKSWAPNLTKYGLNKRFKGKISNHTPYILSGFDHFGMLFSVQMIWYFETIISMMSWLLATKWRWLVKNHLPQSLVTRTNLWGIRYVPVPARMALPPDQASSQIRHYHSARSDVFTRVTKWYSQMQACTYGSAHSCALHVRTIPYVCI